MKTPRNIFLTKVMLATTLFCLGCGGGATGLPDYAPVSGTVTMNGQPLEGASVSFTPKSGTKHTSIGITDSKGQYELVLNRVAGAVIGEHSVRISKKQFEAAGEHGADEDTRPTKKKKSAHGHGASGSNADTTDDGGIQLINEEFSGSSSTLSATVKSGQNTFDFDVRGN